MYVICVGNPIDGVALYGDGDGNPFPDGNLANEFAAEEFRNEEWWVVRIYPAGTGASGAEAA